MLQVSDKTKRRLKVLLAVLSVGSVTGVIASTILIARTESSYDDAVCMFEPVRVETVGNAQVHEEVRRCEPSVEERRWVVVRDAKRAEIGRRRLLADHYGRGYRWKAARDADGFVTCEVHNDGARDVVYREALNARSAH